MALRQNYFRFLQYLNSRKMSLFHHSLLSGSNVILCIDQGLFMLLLPSFFFIGLNIFGLFIQLTAQLFDVFECARKTIVYSFQLVLFFPKVFSQKLCFFPFSFRLKIGIK